MKKSFLVFSLIFIFCFASLFAQSTDVYQSNFDAESVLSQQEEGALNEILDKLPLRAGISFGISLVIALISALIIKLKHSNVAKAKTATRYMNSAELNLTYKKDIYSHTTTSVTRRSSSSS